MTRFARAKGSKSSNEKTPEEASSWVEMKNFLLNKSKKSLNQANKPASQQKVGENSEKKNSREWAPLSNDTVENYFSIIQKHHNSNYKKVEKTNSCKHDNEAKIAKKRKISNNIIMNKDINLAVPDKSFRKKKKVSLVNEQKPNHSIISNENNSFNEDSSKIQKKIGSKKKSNVSSNEEPPSKKIMKSDAPDCDVDILISENKRKKKQMKKNKKVNENKSLSNKIFDSERASKKQNATQSQGLTNSRNSVSDIKILMSDTQQTKKNKIDKKKNKLKNKQNPKNINDKQNSKNKKNHNNDRVNSKKNFEKTQKNKNSSFKNKKFYNSNAEAVKEIIVNGEKVKIVKFQGFNVTLEDAERLKKLRADMFEEGIPREKLEAALKLERRRAEKALSRLKKAVCFHCRGPGHALSQCPLLGQSENTGTGICYKCGSTEHTATECKVVKGSSYQFAECFICKEQGHIAKQCPDNPRGLYPHGGACRECGSVTHLRKDCPKTVDKKEDVTLTVGVRDDRNLECLDEELMLKVENKNENAAKKKSVVKF